MKRPIDGFYGCIFRVNKHNWYVRWTPGETEIDFISAPSKSKSWELKGGTNLILADGKEYPTIEQLQNHLMVFLEESETEFT